MRRERDEPRCVAVCKARSGPTPSSQAAAAAAGATMEGIDERFARVYSHHDAATRISSDQQRASRPNDDFARGKDRVRALMKWRDDHCSCSRPWTATPEIPETFCAFGPRVGLDCGGWEVQGDAAGQHPSSSSSRFEPSVTFSPSAGALFSCSCFCHLTWPALFFSNFVVPVAADSSHYSDCQEPAHGRRKHQAEQRTLLLVLRQQLESYRCRGKERSQRIRDGQVERDPAAKQ